MKRNISLLILVLFFSWSIYFFWHNHETFKSISSLSLPNILFLVFLHSVFLFNSGLYIKTNLKEFNLHLKASECFGVSCVTTLFNYLTPFRGGAFIRASYLKKKYSFEYSKTIGTLLGNYILIYWINSITGLLCCIIFLYSKKIYSITLITVLLLTFLFFSVIILHPGSILTKSSNNKFRGEINNIINSWTSLQKKPSLLIKLSFITFSNLFISSLAMYYEFFFIDVSISYSQALLINAVGTFSLFFSITPGSLGIKETFIIIIANLVGINTSDAFLVSIIDRSISIIACFFLSIGYLPKMIRS